MAATSPSPTLFNPFDPVFRGWERYDALAPLREAKPPIAVDPLGRTWVFRYDDVQATLINSDSLEAQETSAALSMGFEEDCPFHTFQQHSMISQNPPRHTRLRKAQAYFGKHQLKPLAPSIRAACDALIDTFPQDGVIEFAYDFAFKLPVGVIMRMLNLPSEDEDRIREWSPRSLPSAITPEAITACDEANAQMRAYVEEVMAQRREQPIDDDIISEMLVLERAGELSHDEIWAQVVPRRVHTTWELHGVTMEPGSLVVPNLAAANRDPRKFPDPDRFDVHRANALTHLAFGAGIHRCLGASLAVLELQIALEALLQRLETVEAAGEAILAPGGVFRCFETLPLHVRRRD
jgi:cytochrome P450